MAHKYKIKGVLHSAHMSSLYCWFSFSWLSFRPVVLPGSPLVKDVKNLCLTPLLSCWIRRRTRCLMGKRNVYLSSLLRHFDRSPRTLVASMRSLWLETVSKKINPILHSNSLYLPLSLIFPSHIINFIHYPPYKLVIFMLAGTKLQECK